MILLKISLIKSSRQETSLMLAYSDEVDRMKKTRQKCELEAFICRSFDFLPQFIVSGILHFYSILKSENHHEVHFYHIYFLGGVYFKKGFHLKREAQEECGFRMTNDNEMLKHSRIKSKSELKTKR